MKRVHDHSSGKPVVVGVEFLRVGQRQRFSPRALVGMAAEGYLTRTPSGLIEVRGAGKDAGRTVTYRVVREPGVYCSFCELPLGSGEDARAHIASEHPGQASPDPSNPAGYRQDNFVEGLLVEA
jgi:hypothetical protein